MTAKHAYPKLIDALDDLRRRWRTQVVIEGCLRTAAGVLLVLVLVVAADNVFQPAVTGRAALAFVLWGTLFVSTLRWVVQRTLEDRRDDYFAALVERTHPELQNRLINALQLGRVPQPGASPQFIQAIIDDAAAATAELDVTGSIDAQPVRRAGVVAVVSLGLVTLYAALFTPRFVNGLSRVLRPLADIAPFTATRIVDQSVKPGDVRIPEGATVAVQAQVEGTIPASAQLLRRVGSHPWQPLPMTPDPKHAGQFGSIVAQTGESFDYQIVAGDGRSRTFHVEVVKRPRVETLALTYTPPAYTAQKPRSVPSSDGEIAALAGTDVKLTLKASKPLKQAAIVTERGTTVALNKTGNGSWAGRFTIASTTHARVAHADRAATPTSPPFVRGGDIKNSPNYEGGVRGGASPPIRNAWTINEPAINTPTRYQIKLLDTDGYENADPLWRSIVAMRDQAPAVVLSSPGRDLQVKPGAEVPITVDARDDLGLGPVRLLYRLNDETAVHELAAFAHDGPPALQTSDRFAWTLSGEGLKAGTAVQYWAAAADRNDVTGPGQGESRRFSIFLTTPEEAAAKLDLEVSGFARMLEALARLQKENRAQTASGAAFDPLVKREVIIRTKTGQLARAMEKDGLPVGTIVAALDDLAAGLMADALRALETGRDAASPAAAEAARARSLPVQDQIIAQLESLLARLQRNEQARETLRKMAKTDQPAHRATTQVLGQMIKDLERLTADQTELATKFEAMPKKPVDELNDDDGRAAKEQDDLRKAWEKWAKGTIAELAKLPTSFTDDLALREDVNRVFEEIEKAAHRPKAEKVEVALEDLGASLATKMLEDLEMWMPDAPDAAKWVLEEPLDKKPMTIPEMPLPTALEDMVGDLLQKADEFDEEADDITSAWGDNLNQAGWGVSDGPISSFSAKGKTGNDLPNNMELSGRSGDGRRGKSSGQMVGDTARALEGRKTPARVNNERYEPGQLKQEGRSDPNGSTGGGKKAGSGRKGLQGGTPPDFVRDIGRLTEKQASLREKAEQLAKKLDTAGLGNRRLLQSIDLMKSAETDLRDLRYQDAARKRRMALGQLRSAFEPDSATAAQLSRARDLPPQLRNELLQAADEGYPAGYESLLKSYFKALSAEK